MRNWLWLLALLPAVPAGWGCTHKTVRPMPGTIPSEGMLLRTTDIPLSGRLRLRRYELLKSAKAGNEFFPWNLRGAKRIDVLVSKLFVRKGVGWHFVDFVEMPRAGAYAAANVSPDGRRIVYERPEVSGGERDWPRGGPRDQRSRRVAIKHAPDGQKFMLDSHTEVYGLGRASHWRSDGAEVAFTTTYVKERPHVRQLVVLDACGQTLLDVSTLKELAGLEYISYSPDGKRIAALRPVEPAAGGRRGGILVEVDLKERAVRNIREIPALVACEYVGRFEKLIAWDAEGQCRLKR